MRGILLSLGAVLIPYNETLAARVKGQLDFYMARLGCPQ
jgi:hypothetical protein